MTATALIDFIPTIFQITTLKYHGYILLDN